LKEEKKYICRRKWSKIRVESSEILSIGEKTSGTRKTDRRRKC